jgi:hydrogenase nickel incorporation protein HypA/HybF
MHELSVAMGIVEGVEEESARHDGHVSAVHLRLGPLSGVVKEALLSAFELACAGSSIEGAHLVIEEVPIVVYCPACHCRQTIGSIQWFCCPKCGAPTSEVIQGKELEIVALEIE